MMPILFGQVCLNGRPVRGGSFGEPPRLFFREKEQKEEGKGRRNGEKSEKGEDKKGRGADEIFTR